MCGTVAPMSLSTTVKACLVTGTAVAAITAAAGPGFAVAAAETVQEVFVANDARNPVPVDASGRTLTVTGDADVSGSTVKLAPGTSVQVEPQTEPFQQSWKFDNPGNIVVFKSLVTVPAGKRLTVTQWNVLDWSRELRFTNLYERCGNTVKAFDTAGPGKHASASFSSEATTLLVGPGCELFVIGRRDAASNQDFEVSVTGFSSDVPAS